MSLQPVEVALTRLAHARDLPLPAYATAGSAGMDLNAALDSPVTLAPGNRALIPTGLAIALPPGFEAQIRPRSGLALHYGLSVLNAPGTIDSDYRGEIGVILINLGDAELSIARGDRIAQLVVLPVARVTWAAAEVLADTTRGAAGYGSTGTRVRCTTAGDDDDPDGNDRQYITKS